MQDCSVVAEEPAGKGLADASLKLAPAWRAPAATPDGTSTAGGSFERYVQWQTGPDQQCAPVDATPVALRTEQSSR